MSGPNTASASSRRVLCVPSEEFKKYVGLHGYNAARLPGLISLIEVLGCYMPKDFTERYYSGYKQVVPYVIVKRAGRVFAYQRSNKGGETRLHDRWSLGPGGHVEEIDYRCDPSEWVRQAAIRELKEELEIVGASPRLIGVVNDDTEDVGRSHVGIVMALTLAEGTEVKPGAEIARHDWMEIGDIDGGSLESWSRHVLKGYLMRPDRRRAAS